MPPTTFCFVWRIRRPPRTQRIATDSQEGKKEKIQPENKKQGSYPTEPPLLSPLIVVAPYFSVYPKVSNRGLLCEGVMPPGRSRRNSYYVARHCLLWPIPDDVLPQIG